MNKKQLEKLFDQVADKLGDVQQVDGFDGERYQIDRSFEEDNGTLVDEWVDLRHKNNKINIAITQESLFIDSDDEKGIKRTKQKLKAIKPLIEKTKDCTIEIRSDFDGKPHILSIKCSDDISIPVADAKTIQNKINFLSIDLLRKKVPFEKEFDE